MSFAMGSKGQTMTLSTLFSLVWCPMVVLLLLAIATTESVPTLNIAVGQSQNQGRSLHWPATVTSATHVSSKRTRETQPIQLCGYRLLEAVRGLCRGNYVGYSRRSDPEMQDGRMTMMMRDAAATSQFPDTTRYQVVRSRQEENGDDAGAAQRMSKRSTVSQQHHFRFRRNIIDECCKKPCSVNEMLRYCGRN